MLLHIKAFLRQQRRWPKWLKGLIVIVLLFVLVVNHIEFHKIGIARNLATGTMWVQYSGWHVTWPWVIVSEIDTRPVRVSVQSSGRGFDSRLVRFVPEQWKKFVDTEGFRYYWWSNRISFNMGHREEHRGMRDVLRGYAYDPKPYPFIEIMQSY